MEFRILGSLDVSRDEEPVGVGGPREHIILSMLLLEANHVVPIERLIMAVWDEEPPTTARAQVQICISTLRRHVLVDDSQRQIIRRRPGYMLALNGHTLDAALFEARIVAARELTQKNEFLDARDEFRAALELWRGRALDGIPSRLVQQSVAKLNERRLTVIEECMDCELRLGRHQDLVGELVGLAEEYPLCERLRALLMMALCGAGRPAEALDVYRHARETLIDELGVEPSKELQELQLAILNGRPLPGAPEISAPVPLQPAIRRESVHVPRLLPAAISDFTGYGEFVDRLVTKVTEDGNDKEGHQPVHIDIIVGQGGVGKTTLAVHVAHKLAPQFPDGQLFARLRSDEYQVNPNDILERFLRAFGITSPVLPDGIEERAEMYRNLLGDRRVLIVLDDAVSERQVAALLPGNSRCTVIVTSRKRLTGIAASRVELHGFVPESAVEMLTSIVGPERIGAEPDAVSALCRLCRYLPVALRIVAARLAARPHWSVSDLVSRLQDDSHRLDELNHDGVGVRASISLTLKSLSADAQRLFRLLAVANAPSFASWIGSPLLQMDLVRAQDLLEELTEAYLIDAEQDPVSGQTRYRFHDIIRPFARECLAAEENAQDRQKSLEHLLGALLYLAGEAHRREYQGGHLLLRSGASRWPLPDTLVKQLMRDPLAWYEGERESLVSAVLQAAASGLVEHSWDLALNSVTFFEAHEHYDDWRRTHEAALKASCQSGDLLGEATMRYSLGSLYMFERRGDEASRQLSQAFSLYNKLGDRHGSALVLRNIAHLNRIEGELELALARWEQALGTLQIVGDRVVEAHVLHNMAQVHLDLGNEVAADELLDRAQRICANVGNRRVGAQVLHRIGDLRVRRGELELAGEAYLQVLAAVREVGDQIGECYALLGQGIVQFKRGELEVAMRTLTESEGIAARVGDPMVRGRVALAQAEITLARGQLDDAVARCDVTISIFEEMKAAKMRAEALLLRGRIHAAAGQREGLSTAD
jgi:DNA-binding SARP family transcriptional activator/tetratricopeptide (TPR) repeat protein